MVHSTLSLPVDCHRRGAHIRRLCDPGGDESTGVSGGVPDGGHNRKQLNHHLVRSHPEVRVTLGRAVASLQRVLLRIAERNVRTLGSAIEAPDARRRGRDEQVRSLARLVVPHRQSKAASRLRGEGTAVV